MISPENSSKCPKMLLCTESWCWHGADPAGEWFPISVETLVDFHNFFPETFFENVFRHS